MRPAKLCVTVTAATTAELRTRRDEVVDADLIELRLDSVRDPERGGRARRAPASRDRDLPFRGRGRGIHGQ